MLYSSMSKNTGYEISKKDIETTVKYLKSKNLPHSIKDAKKYLSFTANLAHLLAHQIVDDEQSGKIKKVKTN